jgi:putative Holliday junction resolvase
MTVSARLQNSISMPSEARAATPETVTDRRRGAVMAFDFGERRIGIAVGDLELGIAHPLETMQYRHAQDPLAMIEPLVVEWQPVLFVVGLPVSADGTEHNLAPIVRRFSAALTRRFGVATTLIDERYTSAEASGMLRNAGVRGRRQKEFLDQVAAQTILEDFFSNDKTIS